jgi:hypothetical protein
MTDDEFDRLVTEWHESDSELDLHEYLGMTWEEFRLYPLYWRKK